ncbi:MAG: hypothetical protein J5860_04565 [Clostridia bacterium]|nr:hypothetical protein [Clostridia bacterium]
MSWRKLTWLAIAVLIIINAAFAITISSDYVSNNYYDAASVAGIIDILSESGITLENKDFPTKRVDLPVYNLPDSESALKSAAMAMSDGETEYADGAYTFRYGNGTLTLHGDFTFEYAADSYVPSEYGGEPLSNDKKAAKVKSASLSFIDGVVEEMGGEARKKIADISYAVDSVRLVSESTYRVGVCEYIDTYKTMNEIDVVVENGNVVSAKGSMIVLPPTGEFSANNFELFDILIKEKRYFDGVENAAPMTVSSIEYIYDMCFDVFNNIYLIPACAITYTDGTVHIYDVVSSDLISE